MTDVKNTSFLREQLHFFSPNSTILKSYDQDIESFNIDEILELLLTAEYFYEDTDNTYKYFEFSNEEVNALVLELNELSFKILLKSSFDWKYNSNTIGIFATTGPFRDILIYLYYGYGSEILKTYFDKTIFKMSMRDYEEALLIFNISGPTIKEILRPILNLNKIRLLS